MSGRSTLAYCRPHSRTGRHRIGGVSAGVSFYLPDASGVMGYNWRSAHYFASRGDLSIQKFETMPILILHGDVETGNPVPLDLPFTQKSPVFISVNEIGHDFFGAVSVGGSGAPAGPSM
jgi:hypothetical protein